MKLSRSDLKLGITDKTLVFSHNQLPERNINFFDENIKCNISSQKKTRENFYVYGKLFIKVKYECVRCLDQNIINHNLPFNIDILSSSEANKKSPDRFDYIPFEENKKHIDLSEAFADIIALAKPIKPLCKSECLGICIICGKNKNRVNCSCNVSHQSNAWDKLKKLNIK